jgi:hypothetical protein
MNAALSNAAIIAQYLDAVIRKDASAMDRYFRPEVEYMVNGAGPGWKRRTPTHLSGLSGSPSLVWPPSWPGGAQEFFGSHPSQPRSDGVWPARGRVGRR